MKPRYQVILFYLFLIIFWQTAFKLDVLPMNFPSPKGVIDKLVILWKKDWLLPGIQATLTNMALGFGLSVSIGIVVGVAMGMNRVVNRCLRSLLLGLQTLPTVAWAPLAVMIFGVANKNYMYFVIVMSSVSAVAISTADGIANIPPLYLRAARTLGATPWAMGLRVVIPASLPSTVSGVKLGWTMGWHGAVSAEIIRSSVGLGYLLHYGRELGDLGQVVTIMIVTIIFGLILDQFLFGIVERRIRARWGLNSDK
jgi:NitT/TauT family transport system permease protein